MQIRPETPTDAAAIRHVVDVAFRGAPHSDGTEAAIVDALRLAGALSLSLVAESEGRTVGHVAFSPVTVDGVEVGLTGLGPLAVLPEAQGRGIGTALVWAGLGRLGGRGCVVLGDARYYRRFGFAPCPGLWLPGVPPEHFMALAQGRSLPQGAVAYHPAFGTGAA
ncbi:MAG: GNAT family N-acetyltransferase [Alkalilacustris sp.]